ncbi:MAG TPA: DUF4387 domain-containing protein [Ureibacillus sp.]|nr:DUF4387 domain-containing protein [Ureibacillus sp.]
MVKLVEKAKILRSKNAGPFEITLDVLFDEKQVYEEVKNAGILTKEVIADLYNISLDDIHHLVFFDQALGIKITIARKISSGSPGDRDVYGAQQHAPLMNLEL